MPKPVGNGGVDLHGLQSLSLLLALGLVLHGAHIVQPVAHLDENDPDVLGHGHEHLAQVLHLLLLFGGILHSRQLGDPFHQVGHGGAELLGDLVVGGVGVLDTVMEQGGNDGVHVQPQIGYQLGHGNGVGDIGLPCFAQLLAMVGIGVFKKPPAAVWYRHGVAGAVFFLLIADIAHGLRP